MSTLIQIQSSGGGGASGIWGISNASGVYTYYATLTLAMVAAVAGQTIELFADVTETGNVTVTLKNGVNINGNGHTYTLNTNDATNAFITAPSVETSFVMNNLTIVRSVGSGAGIVLGLGSSTLIDFTGTIIKNTGTGIAFSAESASPVEVYNLKAIANSGVGIQTNNPNQVIKYSEGKSTSNYGIWSINGGAYYNCIGTSSSNWGIYAQTPSTSLNTCIGISSSSAGISNYGNAYRCIGRSNSSVGFINYLTAYSCTGISVSGAGLSQQGGNAINCEGISNSNYGIRNASVIEMVGCTAISSNNAAIWHTNNPSGGIGTRLYDCKIISDYANAAGVGVLGNIGEFPTGLYRCTFRLNSSLAPYLNNGGVAKAMEFVSNIYRGGAVYNPNLTQSIVSTEDNQGNIFV